MYGLNEREAKEIIKSSLLKNPDLKYYINNDYIEEIINLLIEGVAKAIEENNRKIVKDVERELKLKSRYH